MITTKAGNKYVLTCLDLLTRFVSVVPLRTKNAEDVVEAIFSHLFCVHCRPKKIISDEGRKFVNAGLTYLCRRWGTRRITTGGYQPQALPAERFHRFLNHGMTTLAAHFGEEWPNYIPAMVFAYNSSVSKFTMCTPFNLMFGRDPRLMQELVESTDPSVDVSPVAADGRVPDFAIELGRRFQRAYDLIRVQQDQMVAGNRSRRAACPIQDRRHGPLLRTATIPAPSGGSSNDHWRRFRRRGDERQGPNKVDP